MISAEHKKWAEWIFQHYLNRLFKQHFYTINLVNPVPDFNPRIPLLLLPNHSSWWDGFFIFLLNNKLLHRKVYLMMLEEQLKINRFFRYLGAYSINSNTFNEVKQSMQYTIDLLNGKEKPPLVCFFPQGELHPWHTRPIVFKRGLEFILRRIETEINLCFLGIRIEFLGEQRPEVFLQLSSLKEINHKDFFSISKYASEFTAFLNQLEKKIATGEKGQILFQGKKSINEQYHTYRKRGH
jgi:hypothetical protein